VVCIAKDLGLAVPDNGAESIASFDITNGETEDSTELTAMEKITKLKTQWLNQIQ